MDVFNQTGSVPFVVGDIRTKDEIEESTVWQNLTETRMFQFTSAINRVSFSPMSPFSVVALSGLTGPWIDIATQTHKFSYAKTKAPFSSIAFRKDGILVALGREDGVVDIYPTKDHQTLLRRFKLNCGVIFCLAFSPFSNSIVAGCGNGSVHILDIARVNEPIRIDAHTDAVSSIIPLESGNIWVTGSHDCSISVWDFNSQTQLSKIDAPEAISRMVNKGRRVFAASGENLFVADILSQATKVACFAAHTRPIVGMCIVRSNLVTASADRSIKVFEPSSFSVLHSIKVHSDITAFDSKPDASAIAIGLAGGVVQLKYVTPKQTEVLEKAPQATMPANFRVFKPQQSKKKEKWNQRLKKFEFAEALDLTLKEEDPSIVIGMIDELDRVGGLDVALSGRDAAGLVPILEFLVKHVANPTWSHVALKAVMSFIRIYRPVIGDVPSVGQLFDELTKKIHNELGLQKRASEIIGKIDLIIS